jgi:hypothetical protein
VDDAVMLRNADGQYPAVGRPERDGLARRG